ncbi:MAG: hypothetical protein ACRD4X_12690, partial [Candidatus Acidiferrales bacterium]
RRATKICFPRKSAGPILIPLLASLLLSVASAAFAQTDDSSAIRVQSSEVLVPVVVLDKKKIAGLRAMDPYVFGQKLNARDFSSWEALAVRGLTAADFKVFEDGQEQFVRQVRAKPRSGPPLLRDNLGYFSDFLGVGGGIWTVPNSSSHFAGNITFPPMPGYVVGYTPPPSPGGSCHQIAMKVDRPQLVVYSRREYCDTQVSAADPLRGTKLGKKLASDIGSRRKGKIPLSLVVFAPFTSATTTPVQIFLHFPTKPLTLNGDQCAHGTAGTIALLGALYTSSGNLAARFSDFASQRTDSNYFSPPLMALWPQVPGTRCIYDQPSRYRSEVSLLPGKYILRVVLREGKEFGRARMPLVVRKDDPKQLAISEIALVRRFRDVAANPRETATVLPENLVPLLAKHFEVTPAGDTRFKASDPFYFYLQLYVPPHSGASRSPVKLAMKILDANTRKLVRQIDSLNAASYATPGDPIVPIAGGIDITKLPQGSYQLQAQAIDSSGARTPWRFVTFTIY